MTQIVDPVAVDVPAHSKEGHILVVTEVPEDGDVVDQNEGEDNGVAEERGHGHHHDPGVYLAARHFGECDVTGEHGHKEPVTDNVEHGVIRCEPGVYEYRRAAPHEQGREDPEAAPTVRRFEAETLDDCHPVHDDVGRPDELSPHPHGIGGFYDICGERRNGEVDVARLQGFDKLVQRLPVDGDDPLEAEGGAHREDDENEADYIPWPRERAVPQTIVPVERAQVLREEHKLERLHGVPLRRDADAAETVHREEGEEDAAAAVAVIFPELAEGRALSDAVGVLHIQARRYEKERGAHAREPSASCRVVLTVKVHHIPGVQH
mmetsp:Transcript_24119/g.47920  ORF Transcript_24119/g.47920 Transcript_24119/m.47920 type:complete len:321 (-) Transcript_24119:376-1338(-)